MRYPTHILDIKNLLGMQRTPVFPDPLQDPDVLVLMYTISGGYLDIQYAGADINVTETVGGTESTAVYTGSYIYLYGDADTYTKVFPDVTRVNGISDEVKYMAINSTITATLLPADLEILDLRNASALTNVMLGYPSNLNRLYANCTNAALYAISKNAITNSGATGTVYIKRGETYTDALATDAINQSWEVVLYD